MKTLFIKSGSARDPIPSRRAFFCGGLSVLACGGAALLGILVFRLSRHNSYLVFTLAWFLLGLAAAGLIGLKTDASGRKHLFLWSMAVAGAVSAALVAFTPLPITGVSLRVRLVPESMQFSLRQPVPGRSDVFVSVYRSRGKSPADLDFVLSQPLESDGPPLRFYAGQRPRRLYYGRHFFPCDVLRLSYGTDVFFFYVSLADYQGSAVTAMARASEKGSLRDIDGHTLRVWGPLDISGSAGQIRAHSAASRVLVIKCFWVMFLVAAFALGLWSRCILGRTLTLRRRVETFLAA